MTDSQRSGGVVCTVLWLAKKHHDAQKPVSSVKPVGLEVLNLGHMHIVFIYKYEVSSRVSFSFYISNIKVKKLKQHNNYLCNHKVTIDDTEPKRKLISVITCSFLRYFFKSQGASSPFAMHIRNRENALTHA